MFQDSDLFKDLVEEQKYCSNSFSTPYIYKEYNVKTKKLFFSFLMLDCHLYRLLYIVYRSVCIISSITVADVKRKKSKKSQ